MHQENNIQILNKRALSKAIKTKLRVRSSIFLSMAYAIFLSLNLAIFRSYAAELEAAPLDHLLTLIKKTTPGEKGIRKLEGLASSFGEKSSGLGHQVLDFGGRTSHYPRFHKSSAVDADSCKLIETAYQYLNRHMVKTGETPFIKDVVQLKRFPRAFYDPNNALIVISQGMHCQPTMNTQKASMSEDREKAITPEELIAWDEELWLTHKKSHVSFKMLTKEREDCTFLLGHEWGHSLIASMRIQHELESQISLPIFLSLANDQKLVDAINARVRDIHLIGEELFADAVGVLLLKDIEAAKRLFLEDWENPQRVFALKTTLKSDPSTFYQNDNPHIFYNPVRSYLGRVLDQSPEFFEDPAIFLEWLANGIFQVETMLLHKFEQEINSGKKIRTDYFTLHQAMTLNQRLLKILKKSSIKDADF